MKKMQENVNGRIPVPYPVHLAAAWAWRLIVIVFAVAVTARILFELRVITVPMFVALLLSTVLVPPVRRLERLGFSSGLATTTVFGTAVLIIAMSTYFLADTIAGQFNDLVPQLSRSFKEIQNWLVTGPLQISNEQLQSYFEKARVSAEANISSISESLTKGATVVGEVVVGFFVTIILTFFFTKDGSRLVLPAVGRFPAGHRDTLMTALRRGYTVLGGYLRGVAATGLVDAFSIGVGLVALNVPLAGPLVILTFFGAFFPLVGATIAGALAVLVALVNNGPAVAGLVLLVVLAVQQIEGHLLQPLLVGRAVRLHPAVVLFVLAAGGIAAGLLGAFLAVPVTAVTVAVWREIETARNTRCALGVQGLQGGQTVQGEHDAYGVQVGSDIPASDPKS